MTNADASLLVVSVRADALIHKALHGLLVRSPMELVALFVLVTACTVCNFPLAQHVDLVLLAGAVLSVHRKGKVLLVADALALAAQRSDTELGDALVRVATLLFVVHHR